MRLVLEFELKKSSICVEYRKQIVSFIKHSLQETYGDFGYNMFYKGTKMKNFTYSVIFQKPKFKKNVIELEGNFMKVIFSAYDKDKTGLYLYHAFIGQKGKWYPMAKGNEMILRTIREKKQEKIVNSKILIKTTVGSGIVVRKHNLDNKDIYYSYEDTEFIPQLQLAAKNQVTKAGFSDTDAETIKFKVVQAKKVVCKNYNIYVDATIGMFQIEATPSVLQFFCDSGLGNKTSLGFGTIDLISQDLL